MDMIPPLGSDGMMEGRHDGMTEDGKVSAAKVADIADKVFGKSYRDLIPLAVLDLFKGAVESLRGHIEKGRVPGINWKNPFAQLDYEAAAPAEIAGGEELLDKAAALDRLTAIFQELRKPPVIHTGVMLELTREVYVLVREDGTALVHLPPALDKEVAALPEADREGRLAELGAGFKFEPPHLAGTVDAPGGKEDFAADLVFGIRPLTVIEKTSRAFFPILVGLDFKQGDPAAWSEEDRGTLWEAILAQLDALAAPYLEALKGADRLPIPRSGRAVPIRAEYFHAPGRLFDTPRHAAVHSDTLPEIGRWYLQTAFNRTVGMAAAALTRTESRDAILGWQSATVEEVADLVFCRTEVGTSPSYGQNREDILKAFEALRAIPVPIVQIDWKQVGTDRNPRWIKEYKLRVASLLQSYGAVFIERKTGKKVLATDPARKRDLVKGKADRRKTTKALVTQNPADGILQSFPPDRYKLTGFEWRWNTDIAEDFICPKVALDAKRRPRLKLTGGRHIEGSRFINLNRRYFAVQKHLRDSGSKYAPRLLDLIVSEKTHIVTRGKGAVWIEISADKIVKGLDLWTEYQNRPKHVLEDHVAPAVMALIHEKVMLPESGLVPQTDKNPDRRKTPFFRWKVAELWSTVALVPPEEAKEVEDEIVAEAEAAEAALADPAGARKTAGQAVLPGLEELPAPAIPTGQEIRAARKASGLTLRSFADAMSGPDFSTWSRYESGKPIRTTKIAADTWKRVNDFIEKNRPKTASEGGLPEAKKWQTVT